VVEGGVKPWSEDQWIEDLTDPANSFSGLAALAFTVEDVQGTGQAIPGSPVMGQFKKCSLERGDR
jgi:hypothetical protein